MSFDVSLCKIPEGVTSLFEAPGDQTPMGPLADVRNAVEDLFESIEWTDDDDKFFHAIGALDGARIEVSLSKDDPCAYVGFALRGGSSILERLFALGRQKGWALIDDQEGTVMDEESIKQAFGEWEKFRDSIEE